MAFGEHIAEAEDVRKAPNPNYQPPGVSKVPEDNNLNFKNILVKCCLIFLTFHHFRSASKVSL